MAKTRIELINDELDAVTEIIEQQFIERDICMLLGQDNEMNQVNEDISLYMRRREALQELLQASAINPTNKDFNSVITIQSPQGN